MIFDVTIVEANRQIACIESPVCMVLWTPLVTHTPRKKERQTNMYAHEQPAVKYIIPLGALHERQKMSVSFLLLLLIFAPRGPRFMWWCFISHEK